MVDFERRNNQITVMVFEISLNRIVLRAGCLHAGQITPGPDA